jgi:hypothetical protein
MAAAVVGVLGSLLSLGGGGGGEASVAESAKRLQDGDVRIVIDSENKLIAFQIEESEDQCIVIDVEKRTISGLAAQTSSPSYVPPPGPYQYVTREELEQLYYTKAEVSALIMNSML